MHGNSQMQIVHITASASALSLRQLWAYYGWTENPSLRIRDSSENARFKRCAHIEHLTFEQLAGADPGILEMGGPVKGRSPEPSAEGPSAGGGSWGPPPENFEKLDAISCNLAYIFGIRMASDIIQNWAFAEQKTVAATTSIHTHTRIHPHTSKNSSDFGHCKIQIQFQKYFLDLVYNVKKLN